MVKFALTPPLGYRTYRLHLASLIMGGAILVFGILKGADLMNLGVALASLLGPVTGFSAWSNRGKPAPEEPTGENPSTHS